MKKLLLVLLLFFGNLANAETLLQLMHKNLPSETIAQFLNDNEANIDIDAQDRRGNTAMHYLLGTYNATLINQALKLQPRLNIRNNSGQTALQFTYETNGLVYYDEPRENTFLSRDKAGFTLKGKIASPKKLVTVLDKNEVTRLVAVTATVESYNWRQQQSQPQRQQWQAKLERQKQDFSTWQNDFNNRQQQLQKPIPEIPPVKYPEVAPQQQSAFENLSMFRARMGKAKNAREQQVEKLESKYRKKVEVRNLKVTNRNKSLQQLEREVAIKNTESDTLARNFAKQQQQYYDNLAQQALNKKPEIIAHAVAQVYGSPYLSPVGDAFASYNSETQVMQLWLNNQAMGNKKVTIPVPIGVAESFFNTLENSGIPASLAFTFDSSDNIQLSSIFVDYNGENLAVNNSDSTFETQ